MVEQSKLGVKKLIGRHYEGSVRMANSILRNQPDAEDVVQMAYGRAFQKMHTFREEARFSTRITSSVVNQSLIQLRGNQRATLLSLEEPIPYISRTYTGGKHRPAREFHGDFTRASQVARQSADAV